MNEFGYLVRGPVVAAQEDVKAERAAQRVEFSADADDALMPAEWGHDSEVVAVLRQANDEDEQTAAHVKARIRADTDRILGRA